MAASTPRSKVDATEYKKFVASRMEGATVSENTGVMRSSAESDVLRRVTRMEIQRDITFVERNRDELLRPESDGLLKIVSRAAKRDLQHARSQEAYLDSKLLALSADMGSQQMQRLNTGQATFDTSALMIRLCHASRTDSYHADNCNFAEVGRMASFLSRRAPAVEFLLGPIQIQRRVTKRGPVQRIARNAAQLQQPIKLTENEAKRYENQTTAYVHSVYERLAESDGPVNALKFVINPASFSQTVENIFFLSFLVQQRRARMYIDEADGMPYAETRFDPEGAPPTNNQIVHFIFDITEKQWRQLTEELGITESAIPTRPPAV